MQQSSDLVLKLHGVDAEDGMFDLVFNRAEGSPSTESFPWVL